MRVVIYARNACLNRKAADSQRRQLIMCTKNIVPHRNGSAKIDGRNEKTEKASES